MKRVYFLLGLLIILLLSMSDAPERFEWSENKPLQWSDFKGSPATTEGWAATSSTGISQSYHARSDGFINKDAIVVKAHFYPEYSWVRHNQKSRHLLGHEQTHFDITEVYARRLAKRIQETTFTSNALEEIKVLYQEIEKERVATQTLFDEESEHSINHTKEIQWELKVKRWLEETK